MQCMPGCVIVALEFSCISYGCAAALPPFSPKTCYSAASSCMHPGLCRSSSLCCGNNLVNVQGSLEVLETDSCRSSLSWTGGSD